MAPASFFNFLDAFSLHFGKLLGAFWDHFGAALATLRAPLAERGALNLGVECLRF